MWESGEWGEKMWRKELKARIPAEILQCRAVAREINFSSVEKMEGFKVGLYGQGVKARQAGRLGSVYPVFSP